MKFIYLTLSWLLGILLILSGFIMLFETPLAGVIMISASLLILPPARDFVYSKTKKEISFTVRSLTVFALIVVASMFIEQNQDKKEQEIVAKEQAEKIAPIKQQNIDYFFANRETIIAALNTNLASNDFQAVISTSSKYLASGDDELNKLYSTAKDKLDKIQKDKKTKDLLSELKKTPTKEFEKNKNLYSQLASLYPDNERYKNKIDFYSKKIEKQKEIKLTAEARAKEEPIKVEKFTQTRKNIKLIIESLDKNYGIKAKNEGREDFCSHDRFCEVYADTVQIQAFGYKVDPLSSSQVTPAYYQQVCSAVLIALSGGANKELVEQTIVQSFNYAAQNGGARANVLGVDMRITPNHRGLLECSFFKKR